MELNGSLKERVPITKDDFFPLTCTHETDLEYVHVIIKNFTPRPISEKILLSNSNVDTKATHLKQINLLLTFNDKISS